MSDTMTDRTAVEDRVPVPQMLAYGSGAMANNLLAGAIGGMMIVLNIGLGMNPALVGLLGLLPRLFDAFTDPLIGYMSDNTNTRWGRRRPFIFFGAIAVGLVFMMLWQLPEGKSEAYYFWYFLGGSLVFYLAYTIFATPWVALGFELTPDYNERSRLMGVQYAFGQVAYIAVAWLLWIMANEALFDNLVDGARTMGIVVGAIVICLGLLPAVFLKERDTAQLAREEARASEPRTHGPLTEMMAFFKGALITLSFKPFLKLCIAAFFVFNGFMLVAAFQSYVLIYYLFGGDNELGGLYLGYLGTLSTILTFGVVAFVTWLATKIGKQKTLLISISISMFGYMLKYFCYNTDYPLLILLPVPLIAFGLGGLFTIVPAMIADVVDLDEYNTHERREGMYASIFWWVIKLGLAAALGGGGVLLNVTGFDVDLGGAQTEQTLFLLRLFDAAVPALASAFAIWAIASSGVTKEKAHSVRLALEERRGKSMVAA